MVPKVDAKYGVYVQGPSGRSFNMERFRAYLEREGIDWPQTENGKLIMRQKVFEGMCKAWPQLEDLRQLRHVRNKMRKIKLAVGADDRNRTVLWPFQSKTSRTQPKASQWIFSPAVWLRSLIKPEPGMAVAYIDCSGMEFLIAAVLSDKHCGPVNRMLDAYNSGDPYLAFARQVGAVPRDAIREAATERCATTIKSSGSGRCTACRKRPWPRARAFRSSRPARCCASTVRSSRASIGGGRMIGSSTPYRPASCAPPWGGLAHVVSMQAACSRSPG